jgi:hypothetical protein
MTVSWRKGLGLGSEDCDLILRFYLIFVHFLLI